MRVTVILPTYNEAPIIAATVSAVAEQLGPDDEILVVDDQSSDGTVEAVEALGLAQVRCIRRTENPGLAQSIKDGMRRAAGEILVWLDADLSHPPSCLPKLLEALQGADLVMASRYVPGGADRRHRLRVFTSWLLNAWARLLLDRRLYDYTTGYVAARREVFSRVGFPDGHGSYCMQLLYSALLQGFRITEVPYVNVDRSRGTSKICSDAVQFCRIGLAYLLDVVAIRRAPHAEPVLASAQGAGPAPRPRGVEDRPLEMGAIEP